MNLHYDATREVRAKGAGFYQFSGDEETRQQQMEELRKVRGETEKTRQGTGAVDVLPGEVEGMVAPAGAGLSKSRAMEKRKRELEERRRLLDAKRRKKNPEAASSGSATASTSATPQPSIPRPSSSPSPGPHLPDHEPPRPPPYDLVAKESHSLEPSAPPLDPFAALEAQTAATKRKGKGKLTATVVPSADDFLATLERDILHIKR